MTPAQTAACISQLPTDTLALVDKLYAPGLTREKLLGLLLRSQITDMYTCFNGDYQSEFTPAMETHLKFLVRIPLGSRLSWSELDDAGGIKEIRPANEHFPDRYSLMEGVLVKGRERELEWIERPDNTGCYNYQAYIGKEPRY